jgi:hypothetical protein
MTATLPTSVTERTEIALGPDERIVGEDETGRPLVRTTSGRAGLTFGVSYVCDGPGYCDLEAYDETGWGAW